MSAILLRNADHVHELADDRESAFWVLTWVLLRYTQHNLSPDDLAERMSIFDEMLWIDGTASGGDLKMLAHLEKIDISEVQFAGRPGLPKLINNLAHIFSLRYRRKHSEEVFGRNMDSVAVSSFNVLILSMKCSWLLLKVILSGWSGRSGMLPRMAIGLLMMDPLSRKLAA